MVSRKEYMKKWRENNREECSRYSKKWRKDNRKYIKEYNKEWLKNNPEYHKENYMKNREKYLEDNRKFRIGNPEYRKNNHIKNRKRNLEVMKEYYKNNRKHLLELGKKWREGNKDKIADYQRKFSKTEKGKANNQRGQSKRRSRMKDIINNLTNEEWLNILKKYKYRCAYCDKEFNLFNKPERDHIIPISKGGYNTKENIVPACRSCNAKKNDKLISHFSQH